MLIIQTKCGIIRTNHRWFDCPVCGRTKILRLRPDLTARNLPVYCRACRTETIVNIWSEP